MHIKNFKYSIKNWVIMLIAQFLIFYSFSKIDFAIDLFSNFYQWQKNFHTLLFSEIPFSVGDLIYLFLILFSVFETIKYIRFKRKKSILLILIGLNIFYFSYQFFWGMLYFQEPLISKMKKKEVTEKQLKQLTIKYLILCKATREKVSEDNFGVFKIKNLKIIEQEILKQQHNIPQQFKLKKDLNYISTKPSLGSYILNYTGISGYYNPFTAEAQYNKNLPNSILPFTIAHETAHQLGFAREQEASFIAFLCAKNSQNQELRYSIQLYVLKSLLRNLAKNPENKDFIKYIIDNYSQKMKLDKEYESRFSEKYESILNDIFSFTNDLFLKSNQQDGSISYSYFINLLIAYEL